MLFLHEVHTLAGAREDEFEQHVREGWVTGLAHDSDARLVWYLKLAHGTGRAYQATTVTAIRDGAAYERLARRVHDGDLRSWSAAADTMRREVAGKVLLPVSWSPNADLDLDAIPVAVSTERSQTLFMEDSAWPYEGRLDDYLEKARTHYAPSLQEHTERSLLELVGVFQAALGAPRRREVVLWQRVLFPERLPGLFTHDLPARVKGPGTWMHDALEVRDDWESRLLRTATWSPLQ
jgi:hypothetical protein